MRADFRFQRCGNCSIFFDQVLNRPLRDTLTLQAQEQRFLTAGKRFDLQNLYPLQWKRGVLNTGPLEKSYNGILFNLKKKGNVDTCYITDEL